MRSEELTRACEGLGWVLDGFFGVVAGMAFREVPNAVLNAELDGRNVIILAAQSLGARRLVLEHYKLNGFRSSCTRSARNLVVRNRMQSPDDQPR
jgi:hypothetical protein